MCIFKVNKYSQYKNFQLATLRASRWLIVVCYFVIYRIARLYYGISSSPEFLFQDYV